ncbi:MAG: AsmA-like C-terminal region-containing protein [Verrucomicrobiae bacterium]|nr:AsmA-like C-terminal region-containing protein [Verrucomicrobiae bacterium]NNJ42988.1 hypothetical protein [Akkermansiaceae bacterium]
MLRRRIFIHLRFALVLGIGLVLGSLVGGAYYLNQSGLNDQWRERIAQELENRDIVADFESLRFDPTRGMVANGVRIYADESREDVVARLERLVIDVDKTKLMRGIVRVNKVKLKDADISLPLDPDDPDGPRVTMNDLQGDIYLPNKRSMEAREISGTIAGIQILMDAHLWSDPPHGAKQPKPLKDARAARIRLIARIIKEINQWHWPDGQAPRLQLNLEGNIDQPDSARLDFTLAATELERSGAILRNIKIVGDYKNKTVTLDHISMEDSAGKIVARADYRPSLREGRFKADSTLHLQKLARQLFGVDILDAFTFSTPPAIQCTGKISFDQHYTPALLATGSATIKGFSCLGSRFEQLETDFSANGRDTFLTGLHAIHAEGELKGRILFKDEAVLYEADSTLPVSAYAPFLRNSSTEATLKRAVFTPQSKVHLTAKGSMNRNDLTDWVATGFAKLENFTFMDTDLHSLSGNYTLSGLNSDFSDIRAHFDYSDYVLRKKHGGPRSARVGVDSITVDVRNHLVSLSRITGTAWPAPIVRLFAPNVADHVEQYQFHRPPRLRASGTFDLRTGGDQTNFIIDVSSHDSMNYDFLDEPLTLLRTKAQVKIYDDRVLVDDLTFQTFQGACSGNLVVNTSHKTLTRYQGSMQWRRLHLKDIGALYDFGAERGLLTGRIDFQGEDDNMRKFNGKGALALEKGNLFSVPMLGPITQLMGVVLGKRNPTEEKAKDASCSYVIKDGVMYSSDFLATTRSLKFTGEGDIDLEKKQINMLVRMNARGVFGFFTIPLRPFMGLFQFKGKGSLTDPKWQTTMFTNPKRGKKDPLFRSPPKARVVPE